MERIWLKSYPEGVPADINPTAYGSLGDFFAASVDRYRDRDRLCQHEADDDLRRARPPVARLRRLSRGRGGAAARRRGSR